MKVFAISDLHLSLAPPHKPMEVFGEEWRDHTRVIADRWRERVGAEDIVLVPGDISWAMRLDHAVPDLGFIASLPGRKVIIRGNHDYWWTSISQVRACLDASVVAIQNDAVLIDGVAIGGTRLWSIPGLDFGGLPRRRPTDRLTTETSAITSVESDERILRRELRCLELSLSALARDAAVKIAMLHFTPLGPDLLETEATRIMETHGIDYCVFGHLHQIMPDPNRERFGVVNRVRYFLVSCDYLDFAPKLIVEV